jgi:hypothetical protein
MDQHQNNLDVRVRKMISSRFSAISRRSFLTRASRTLFTVAGVTIAGRALLYKVAPLNAQESSDWQNCGLHGYLCNDQCTGGSLGDNPIGKSWVQCCQHPTSCEFWYCCYYSDRCGTLPPNYPVGCSGAIPAGTTWCATASGVPLGDYICTVVSCDATAYDSAGDCQCTAQPQC